MPVNDGFCALAREASHAFRRRGMPSLRELLAAHSPILVLDAAASRIQVGWLERNSANETAAPFRSAWQVAEGESGIALFEGITQLGVSPDAAAAFVFCDGPGSILGIRTAAMALRTWCVLRPRPLFSYLSLALVAHAQSTADVSVIADARRDAWHRYRLGRGLDRVPTTELSGPLMTPEGFRHWTPLPPDTSQAPYHVGELLTRLYEKELFTTAPEPDAFLHQDPTYLTWTPKIHRSAP